MNPEQLKECLRDDFIGLGAELEIAMAANDKQQVDELLSKVVDYTQVLAGAATSIEELRYRVSYYKTSGDPDVTIKPTNDM